MRRKASKEPPKKTHHVFIFRHCPRAAKTSTINTGHGWADPLDYIPSTPHWTSELGACLPSRSDMTRHVGKWLIESGLIPVGDTAQWEIFADNQNRDSTTAVLMAEGIREGLEKLGKNGKTKIGLQTIRLNHGVLFNEWFEADDIAHAQEIHQKKDNIARVPRPTLSFEEAVNLMQVVCGVGRQGNITAMPSYPDLFDLQVKGDVITGAPALLDFFARNLFYSRAGEVDPPFCHKATVRQVYQFVQFIHWTKMAIWKDTNWSARHGAWHAHLIVQVLKHGSFLPSDIDLKTEAILPTDDDEYYETDDEVQFDEIDQEDIDTKVTILLGHNSDLHMLSTVFDVFWEFRDPYYSGVNGSFIPTSPLAGFHAVRYVEEDRIDLSMIYPTIVDVHDPKYDIDSNYFPVDASGKMERTPVLFQREVPFSSVEGDATHIQTSESNYFASVDILENHVLNVLEDYGERHIYLERDSWYKDWQKSFVKPPAEHIEAEDGLELATLLSILIAMFFACCTIWLWCDRCSRKKRRNEQEEEEFDSLMEATPLPSFA